MIFFKHYPVFFFSWLSLFTTTAHGNQEKLGCDSDKPVSFVFHGGSGSSLEDIRYAIEAGVVKMNIDTDTCHGQTPAGVGVAIGEIIVVRKIERKIGQVLARSLLIG